jgi:hypothetical protein
VDPYRSWSPLTEEGYAEKLRLLREASTIPMERWRAPTVLAWLEIALGMPQYGPRCAENVKSGKVRICHSTVFFNYICKCILIILTQIIIIIIILLSLNINLAKCRPSLFNI